LIEWRGRVELIERRKAIAKLLHSFGLRRWERRRLWEFAWKHELTATQRDWLEKIEARRRAKEDGNGR
jgi:hypothetical protein